MLSQNVINSEKQGKIDGSVFHLFYMDLNTIVLFDRDLHVPIMWGSKTVVIGALSGIDTRRLSTGARRISVGSRSTTCAP